MRAACALGSSVRLQPASLAPSLLAAASRGTACSVGQARAGTELALGLRAAAAAGAEYSTMASAQGEGQPSTSGRKQKAS